MYTCSVTAELPADEPGKDGRRDSGFRITSDEAGIRTLEVTAVYTALATVSALDQAEASFEAYALTLQPAGDWDEAATAVFAPDDENKVCDCFIAFREVIHAQSGAGVNDPSLVGENITVLTQRASGANDRGRNAKPLVTVLLSFSTAVRVSSTKDLEAKWKSLRRYLVTVAEKQSGVSGLTVIDENPSPDPSGNRLSGTLTLSGADGSSLLSSQTVVGTAETSGKLFRPVANGDPLAADVHDGPQVHTLVLQSTILEIDSSDAGNPEAFSAFTDAKQKAEAQGYIVTLTEAPLDQRFEHSGQNFSSILSLRRRQRRVQMRKVVQVSASGAGSSSQTRTRTRNQPGIL
jgi:hypothetical protein